MHRKSLARARWADPGALNPRLDLRDVLRQLAGILRRTAPFLLREPALELRFALLALLRFQLLALLVGGGLGLLLALGLVGLALRLLLFLLTLLFAFLGQLLLRFALLLEILEPLLLLFALASRLFRLLALFLRLARPLLLFLLQPLRFRLDAPFVDYGRFDGRLRAAASAASARSRTHRPAGR